MILIVELCFYPRCRVPFRLHCCLAATIILVSHGQQGPQYCSGIFFLWPRRKRNSVYKADSFRRFLFCLILKLSNIMGTTSSHLSASPNSEYLYRSVPATYGRTSNQQWTPSPYHSTTNQLAKCPYSQLYYSRQYPSLYSFPYSFPPSVYALANRTYYQPSAQYPSLSPGYPARCAVLVPFWWEIMS